MSREVEEPAPEPQASEVSEPPGKRRRPAPKRYALKVLCPDELTKAILGPRGTYKDQIQEASGARLIFSNKGDFFPNTKLRTLVILAEDAWSIQQALEPILLSLIQMAEEERGSPNPPPPSSELLGKEAGEYVFRLCIPEKCRVSLIGPGGKNIKLLREQTNCKLFIDNDNYFGNQLAKLIGWPDALRAGLERVNECVQAEAGSEAYNKWLQLVNFSDVFGSEAAATVQNDNGHSSTDMAVQAASANMGPQRPASWDYRGTASASASHDPGQGAVKGDRARGNGGGVEGLAEVVELMPPGTASMDYSVSFGLPDILQPAFASGELQEFFQQLETTTGARPSYDDTTRQHSFVGPLMGIYAAHILLMKKAEDFRQEEEWRSQQENAASVQELWERVTELQRQLEEAKQALAAAKGKGSGSAVAGKGKGKGKKGKGHK